MAATNTFKVYVFLSNGSAQWSWPVSSGQRIKDLCVLCFDTWTKDLVAVGLDHASKIKLFQRADVDVNKKPTPIGDKLNLKRMLIPGEDLVLMMPAAAGSRSALAGPSVPRPPGTLVAGDPVASPNGMARNHALNDASPVSDPLFLLVDVVADRLRWVGSERAEPPEWYQAAKRLQESDVMSRFQGELDCQFRASYRAHGSNTIGLDSLYRVASGERYHTALLAEALSVALAFLPAEISTAPLAGLRKSDLSDSAASATLTTSRSESSTTDPRTPQKRSERTGPVGTPAEGVAPTTEGVAQRCRPQVLAQMPTNRSGNADACIDVTIGWRAENCTHLALAFIESGDYSKVGQVDAYAHNLARSLDGLLGPASLLSLAHGYITRDQPLAINFVVTGHAVRADGAQLRVDFTTLEEAALDVSNLTGYCAALARFAVTAVLFNWLQLRRLTTPHRVQRLGRNVARDGDLVYKWFSGVGAHARRANLHFWETYSPELLFGSFLEKDGTVKVLVNKFIVETTVLTVQHFVRVLETLRAMAMVRDVHGDVRRANIVFWTDEHGAQARFIDFDYSGQEDEARYPPNWRLQITEGFRLLDGDVSVRAAGPLRCAHDVFAIGALMESYKTTAKGRAAKAWGAAAKGLKAIRGAATSADCIAVLNAAVTALAGVSSAVTPRGIALVPPFQGSGTPPPAGPVTRSASSAGGTGAVE